VYVEVAREIVATVTSGFQLENSSLSSEALPKKQFEGWIYSVQEFLACGRQVCINSIHSSSLAVRPHVTHFISTN
jgi:hypothetical protein